MLDSSPTPSVRDEATRLLGAGEEAASHPLARRFEPTAPERFGRYQVRRVLGEGGMGTVYVARDPKLRRDVALKVLRRVDTPSLTTEGRQALLYEARVAAAISHPHVVTIYDIGELDGEPYVAMELLEGPPLRHVMRDAEAGSPRVLRALLQAARGLQAAHAHGLVHRDFKPSNVLLRASGEAVVLDFGLATVGRGRARDGDGSTAPDEPAAGSSDDEPPATDGIVVGTPPYMAPEQHLGLPVDARADQFSLCVVFYEALYGRRPFVGKQLAELRKQACSGRIPEPPSDATAVARRLWPVIRRGLRPDPEQRWPSVARLVAEIEAIATPRRTPRWVMLGLVGIVGLAALAVLPLTPTADPCSGGAERIAAVWNDDVRARVRDAVLAIPVGHAVHTWPRVEAGLDDLGTAWVDTHASVCRALGPEAFVAATDPRVQCLDRRLAELRAFVSLLEQPDPGVLERAVAAMPDRSEINACEAQGRTEPAPALAPAIAPTIARAEQELDEIAVWLQADRIDDVLARARALRAELAGIDHPVLHARICFVLGEALMHHDEPDAAGAELEAGYELALGTDDALAAKLAARLALLRGYFQTRLDEGHTWRRHAEAALERAPPDPLTTAFVERQVAVLLDASGEHVAALAMLERALERLEAHHGPDHVRLLPTLSSLAVVQQQLGRLEAAVATHERTLAIKRSKLGEHHPSMLNTLSNLGVALTDLDRLDEALAMMTDVRERQRAATRGDPAALASIESSIGEILHRRGEAPAARAAFERAVEGWNAWTEERHPDAALALINLGQAAQELDDLALAERAFARAVAIQEALLGSEHPQLARSLAELAGVRREAGEPEAAIALLERSDALLQASDAPPIRRWNTDFELAQALWEEGHERERALELAERSRRILAEEGEGFVRADNLAEVEAWLAPRRRALAEPSAEPPAGH